MNDEQLPPKLGDPLPTIIRGLNPEELFARGMQTVKMSSAGSPGGWKPPRLDEMARLFPEYEVLALLGHGGMGAVYKARQLSLDRVVAIKLLPLQVSRDREFVERFKREAQTMARLHHPNLVGLYGFGETPEGHLFLVMEYVEGATLHDLAHTAGALTPARVVRIVGQVCEGLACAHREGVVHRDIKPANILVDINGAVKIADFGLARSTKVNSGQTITIKGMTVGTPDYMSPEQRRGHHVDQHTDIYALGVVLYEALTGEIPRGVFQPASQRKGLDRRIDAVIERAMHQDPAKRFQSTKEMKVALETVPLDGAAPTQARPVLEPAHASSPASPSTGKKSRAVIWAAVGGSAVVVALLGYALSQPAKSVRPVAPHYEPTPMAMPVVKAATPVALAAAKPSPKPAASAAPKKEDAAVAFGGSRYQLIRSQASWMQAKTEAEFKGGHLAAITTKEEAAWVRETFGPELPRKWARIWIGAYQADRDDTWHWVTDEPFEFADWCPGQPDAAKSSSTPPFFAALSTSLGDGGSNGWDDSASTGGVSVIGYLVEWDEPKAAPPAAPVAMATLPPAPTPAPTTPAPAASEGEQRLAALKAQYDAAYAREIGTTFDAARDELRAGYQSAIDREIAKAVQGGKFADASVLRDERVRAGTGRGLDSDDAALPAVLKPLRVSYRASLAKLDTERAVKLKPVRDGYLRLLDTAHAEFTKAQKPGFALLVKQRRDALTSEWNAELKAAAPVVAETRAPLIDPSAGSSWRKAALLALRFGGRLDIRVDNKREAITIEAELPSKRFDVMKIELADVKKNEKLTDADLEVLATCRELESLRIERAPITSNGLEALRGLPALKSLRIASCEGVNDQFMTVVATLTALMVAEFQDIPITREGIKQLTRCTKLHRVSLQGRGVSAGAIAQLAQLPIEDLALNGLAEASALDLSGFKRLRNLSVNSMKDGKARLIDEVIKLKGLEFLRLSGCAIDDADLGRLGGLGGVKTIEFEGNAIKGPGLASLRACRSLTKLRLHNCGVTDGALDVIGRDLASLQILSVSGAATVQPAAFRSLIKLRGLKEISVSDGVGNDDIASQLAAMPALESINFNQCPLLSDAGLDAFMRLKTLKKLTVKNCTKLTDAAMEAFRKARPGVTLEH
ncbi:MAG: protein kinase [Chthoniobacteraceae bacterium]